MNAKQTKTKEGFRAQTCGMIISAAGELALSKMHGNAKNTQAKIDAVYLSARTILAKTIGNGGFPALMAIELAGEDTTPEEKNEWANQCCELVVQISLAVAAARTPKK